MFYILYYLFLVATSGIQINIWKIKLEMHVINNKRVITIQDISLLFVLESGRSCLDLFNRDKLIDGDIVKYRSQAMIRNLKYINILW
jgi:hypothetical protein